MSDEMLEKDIIEIEDENGNSYSLEVYDYFFYNGEEYAILGDLTEDGQEAKNTDILIMKVNPFVDENGEEMEEFVPVDPELMETLAEVARTQIIDDPDEA